MKTLITASALPCQQRYRRNFIGSVSEQRLRQAGHSD